MNEEEQEVDANSSTGVLPYQAVSVVGLVALLLRWSAMSERMGGMREAEGRKSCGDMLGALLGAVHAAGRWSCPIVLDDLWANPWPRPDTAGPRVELVVSRHGLVDLGGFEAAAAPGPARLTVASRWLRALLHSCVGDLSLVTVMSVSLSTLALRSLSKQLLWHVGRSLQQLVMLALKGQQVPVVSAREVSMSDALGHPHKLDAALVRYVASCRSSTQGIKCFSVATDKSSVCGLQIQNSAIVLPNGTAIVAPPQVGLAIVSSGSHFEGG